MGDWYSTTWTGDQFWAAGGGANSLPTQPLLGESLAEDVQPPGCVKDPCYQMTGMRGARGGRVTQDVTSQENSTNQDSTLSVLNFFHFHSTPFLLLSPFPFTHQNSINSVILIIMISLVLSDEGSRNTPKAYKQVLTLMAGVSTEVISQTLPRPNLSPDLPIHYLVRFSVHRLDHSHNHFTT